MEHLGLSVSRLIRVTYGTFQLGDIEPGQVEEVKRRVLREQLGLIGGDDSGHAKAKPKRVAGIAPARRKPAGGRPVAGKPARPDVHTSELQTLMRSTYSVHSLKNKHNTC